MSRLVSPSQCLSAVIANRPPAWVPRCKPILPLHICNPQPEILHEPRPNPTDDNYDSMAVTFKDGVILGADSRTTTGAYIANRVTDKLTQVHDTIWCCRSGSAADTQAVADIVKYQLELFAMMNGKPPTTQTAAAIFQEICYSNKDRLS